MTSESAESYTSLSDSKSFERKKTENLPSTKEIRGKVEEALIHFGEKQPDDDLKKLSNHERSVKKILASFRGQLSTDPEKVGVGVNKESLAGKCGVFSLELQKCLKKVYQDSEIVSSRLEDHYFLKTYGSKGKIIIDSTLGQDLEGYNSVFVGTPEELKKLIFDYARDGKLSVISDPKVQEKKIIVGFNLDRYFQDRWGDNQNPLYR